MIGKLADGVDGERVKALLKEWETRKVPGYMSSHIMVGDDGKTIVNVAVFDTKENYMALADDPEQDAWYQKEFAPLLDGEPQWVDGIWVA